MFKKIKEYLQAFIIKTVIDDIVCNGGLRIEIDRLLPSQSPTSQSKRENSDA